MRISPKKIFNLSSIIVIFSLCLYIPLGAVAAVTNGNVISAQDTAGLLQVTNTAGAYQTSGANAIGGTGSNGSYNGSAGTTGLAKGVGTCSISTIAAQMGKGLMQQLLGQSSGNTNQMSTQTAGQTMNLLPVTEQGPALTAVQHTDTYTNATAQNSKLLANKSVTTGAQDNGASKQGFNGILSSLSKLFQMPSLDAIGFCIVNEIIRYIGQATIQWINSGFKGSPVFVSNTNQFFKGIADQELGNFVNGLANGALGINLCQPFKVAVLSSTLGAGSGSGYNPLNCSLTQIQKSQYKQFTGGNWGAGGFPSWFSLIQQPNNVYGATIASQQQAYINISNRQNTALIDLNWAKGYRDFSSCKDGSSTASSTGKCANGLAPEKTTLGGYIENEVNARASSGGNRLNIATTFDQIVSSLVNELIKIAINKMTEGSSSGSSGSSSGSGSGSTTYSAPTATCAADITYNADNTYFINWSAFASGGSQNFSYSWSGDVTGTDQSVLHTYTTTGTKNVAVSVLDTDSGQTTSASCSATIYSPLSVSCSATPSTGSVAWSSTVTGGSGHYAYSWTGDASGTTANFTNTYTTTGTKSGSLTVFDTSTTFSALATCASDGTSNGSGGTTGTVATISSLSATSGPIGTPITITGTNFDPSQNYVLLNGMIASGGNKLTSNGTSLTFNLYGTTFSGCNLFTGNALTQCTNTTADVVPGTTYQLSVKTPSGTSGSTNFTVTP